MTLALAMMGGRSKSVFATFHRTLAKKSAINFQSDRMSQRDWHAVTIRIPFTSPEHAKIAMDVISVDKELQAHAVKRDLSLDGDELVATFKTLTVRLARLTLNAYLENVELIIRTLDEFGPDAATI